MIGASTAGQWGDWREGSGASQSGGVQKDAGAWDDEAREWVEELEVSRDAGASEMQVAGRYSPFFRWWG